MKYRFEMLRWTMFYGKLANAYGVRKGDVMCLQVGFMGLSGLAHLARSLLVQEEIRATFTCTAKRHIKETQFPSNHIIVVGFHIH